MCMSIYVCQRMVKKIHHCTFRLKDFIHDFFYPKSCEKWSFHPSKILMTFFNLSTTNSGILLLFSNFPPHHTLFLYLFVIHHCKNRLSSLHIFVHHCTFCASVQVKTSPDITLRCSYFHFNCFFFQIIIPLHEIGLRCGCVS